MQAPQIYLASSSPRRRELLAQIGIAYETVPVAVHEDWDGREAPDVYVRRLALEKARAGMHHVPGATLIPVLGADTAVVFRGEILGKPRNREHALALLGTLSGNTHEVLTAVALSGASHALRLSVSRVTFHALTDAQRSAYCAGREGMDKAGAYAVQGRAAAFISHLEGSYSGIMGLPLFETAQLLREFGIEIFRNMIDTPFDNANGRSAIEP